MAAKRKSNGTRGDKIALLVANSPEEAEVYRVTPARIAAAAKAFPGVLKQLSITYAMGPEAQEQAIGKAEILLGSRFNTDNLAGRAPKLKWIQSTSAGVEKVAPKIPKHVMLTNASGVHGPKGGEYGMTGILMLNHRVPHFATVQRQAKWDQAFATIVTGKTVIILGVGAIGSVVAAHAKKFGMRVLGVSRNGKPHKSVERMYRPKDLPKLLPKADFVVGALPLTGETRGLLGRKELDLLPAHAGIVNLGRAAVIDYEALRDKLIKGELSGAVLDVFPEEPLPASSPLWSTPNLIISPHCGVDDATTYVARCLDIFLGNVRRYLAGRSLNNVVDIGLGY